jgi:hypothetical protein
MHDRPPVTYTPVPLHVVKHDGACGERALSPHKRCNEKVGPNYHVAERVVRTRTTMGVVNVTLWRCHGCSAVWQGSEGTS